MLNGYRRGFTLVEMLVVLGMIVFVASMAMPSIAKTIQSNAGAQSHNMMSGMIKSARTVAFRDGIYTAVHQQIADRHGAGNRTLVDVSFVGVLEAKGYTIPGVSTGWAGLSVGQSPKRVPGTMVFGEVRKAGTGGAGGPGTYEGDEYLAAGVGGGSGDVDEGSDNQKATNDFTTFSVVFTPSGGLTHKPNQQDIFFDYLPSLDPMAPYDPLTKLFGAEDRQWDGEVANANTNGDTELGEPGATVLTMFDYAMFSRLRGDARVTYLNQNAQLLPINALLGMLLERR